MECVNDYDVSFKKPNMPVDWNTKNSSIPNGQFISLVLTHNSHVIYHPWVMVLYALSNFAHGARAVQILLLSMSTCWHAPHFQRRKMCIFKEAFHSLTRESQTFPLMYSRILRLHYKINLSFVYVFPKQNLIFLKAKAKCVLTFQYYQTPLFICV